MDCRYDMTIAVNYGFRSKPKRRDSLEIRSDSLCDSNGIGAIIHATFGIVADQNCSTPNTDDLCIPCRTDPTENSKQDIGNRYDETDRLHLHENLFVQRCDGRDAPMVTISDRE